LWHDEYKRGQEEGLKDRPCAIVLTADVSDGRCSVIVLPITHTPPSQAITAIEIPNAVKRRLGLDSERSWVMLTEANRFIWPGPDLRPAKRGDAKSVVYGPLPYKLFEEIRLGFVAALKARRAKAVRRSE
jgi:PemK-like, MazF-like toxin of type II toxin-antitoxin system